MPLGKWLTSLPGDSRGSILAGGLMIVFITTLLGLALLDLAVLDNRLVVGDDCAARSLYAAEAGLQVAYRDLATTAFGVDFDGVIGDSSYATRRDLTGHVNRALTGGDAQPTAYTVQAQVNGPTVRLWSTGTATSGCPGGPSSVTVQADVAKVTTPGGPGHSFVAGSDMVIGGSGALLDSFDSSKGPYNCLGGTPNCTVPPGTRNVCQQTTPPFTCNVEIWVNGDVSVKTDLQNGPIYANVVSASGRAVNLKSSTTVYGTLTYDTTDGNYPTCNPVNCSQVKGGVIGQAAIAPFNLPAVTDCRNPPSSGLPPFSTSAYVTERITSGTYTYDPASGSFQALGNITIEPRDGSASFCFSEFLMKGKDLRIPETVATEVVINIGSATDGTTLGQAKLDGNIVNSTGQSKYLRIFSISDHNNDDIWVTSGTGSYVFAYAPNGQVQVKAGGAFFGAAFGKKLSATGGSQIHFDKALLSVPGLPGLTGGSGGIVSYSLSGWTQCRNVACT